MFILLISFHYKHDALLEFFFHLFIYLLLANEQLTFILADK